MQPQIQQRRYAAAVCFKQALVTGGSKRTTLTIREFFEAVYGRSLGGVASSREGRAWLTQELSEWLGVSPLTAKSYFRVNRETGEVTETLPLYHGRALLVAYRGLQCFAATQSGVTKISEWLRSA